MTLTVTSPPFQNVNMPALDLRRGLSYGQQEGVGSVGDLTVAQRSAGANMSVDIAAGEAMVQGDSTAYQGKYYVLNDALFNLTGFSAANATNPRVDRVAIRVRDAFHGDAANDVSFIILTGTPTSGATLTNLTGAASVPGGHLLLANVLIPASATTVTTANISNVATQSVGGFVTFAPTLTQSGAVTFTTNTARYAKVGAVVHVNATLLITGSGSAGFAITVGGLPAAASANAIGGSFVYFDSGTNWYTGYTTGVSQTTVTLQGGDYGDRIGISPNIAAANGDSLQINLMYESA